MKQGLANIQDMAVELERRANAKRDFIASTTALHVQVDEAKREKWLATRSTDAKLKNGRVVDAPPEPSLLLALPNSNIAMPLSLGETFRQQMGVHFKVPAEYAERIRVSHPDLYAQTFNTFLEREESRHMVRTLDGKARAFLTDKYRPLDDYDLAQAVLPELFKHPSMKIESSAFTDKRFYLKALFPKLEMEVKVGDPVQIGLVISNSEVGAGSLQVFALVYRLICKNGMISETYGQRRRHIGKRASEEESAYELYSEGTRKLDDAAFFSKVRDTVKGVLSQDVLTQLVNNLREAEGQKIESKAIEAVVEVTANKMGYGEKTRQGILRHLIEGADLSRYGLMNAITRQSQDEEDYDVATRMEMDGGRLIELPKSDWQQISRAELAKAA